MALRQVANFHGVETTTAQLVHKLALSNAAMPTAEDIARAAKMIGLRARIIKNPSAKRLRGVPVPAIFKMRDGTWAIFGVEMTPGRFRVVVPVTQSQEELTIDEVLERLDRDLIVIGKNLDLAIKQLKFGLDWFLPLLKRYRLPMVHFLVCSFFFNLMELTRPLVYMIIINKVLVSKSYSTLTVIICAMVLIAIFQNILEYLRARALSHTSNRIDVELGAKLFNHLLHLPISYFETRPTGVIVTRARELENIRRFLTNQSLPSAIDILFIFIYIAVLFILSQFLTWIIVFMLPIYIVIGAMLRPVYRKRIKDKFRCWSKNQQLLVECVVGMQTLKAAAVEPIMQKLWEERLSAYVKVSFAAGMLGTLSQTGVEFVNKIATAVILFFGVQQVIDGSLTVGGLIAFNMIAQRMTQPILRTAQLYQQFQDVQISLEHLGDILDAPVEPQSETTATPPIGCGEIELRNVSFRYKPDLPKVLKNITLAIKPGEQIGIIGPSGSGKSTLAKLLQRFYLPDSGEILVDGVDIAEVDPAWLRNQLGVVLQENFLFNQTVHGNIALARPKMPRARVIAVAKLAGAHEFITKLPRGYDSLIEERGANLSGGQRQRLAIARALAIDPKVLILDEATSSLDYESEFIIRQNMKQIAKGRTVITIAHRLSAVRHCDRIIGMVDGAIVETGTHEELLRRHDSLYGRLWSMQTDQVSA